jgi:hypothetical protein
MSWISAVTDADAGVGDGVGLAVGEARTTLEAGADVAGGAPTADGDVPHAAADARERARPTASAVRIRLLNAGP